MNITFTLANSLTALGIIGALFVLALKIGRFTQNVIDMLAELKTFSENNAREILSLRSSRHEHGEKIFVLEQGLESVQQDVGDLMHRRKGDKG